MVKKWTISYGGKKRLIRIAAGLVLVSVVLLCIVFPKIVSAGQPIMPLQATLPGDPIIPAQQTPRDSVQEQQLIASLMKDVVVQTDYEKLAESGRWRVVQMRVTGY
ncbi:MAG: hypothetical protein DRP56_07655, partial [Planctomycetota bacterium]